MVSIQKLGWFADNAKRAITIRMNSGVERLRQSLNTPTKQPTSEAEQQPMVIVYTMDIQRNAGSGSASPQQLLVTPLKLSIVRQPDQTHTAMSSGKNLKQRINNSLHNSTLKQLSEMKVQPRNSMSVHHSKPQTLVNAQSRRKNLLDQINKLDNELNTINIEVGEGLHNDPSIRALELVRRMNQERRKRSEKVKLDYERVRKLQEDREIQKRLALEEIQTERYMRKLELEEYERKQRLKASYKKMKAREQDIKGMVESILWELVDSAVTKEDEPAPSTKKSSVYQPITSNQLQSSLVDSGVHRRDLRVSLVKTSGSKSKKLLGRQLPQIVLKVDTSKHIYPKTAFRQKILEQERKRRQMQRELQQQKRKVVSMRRKHNLPAIRLNRQPNIPNQKQNKQTDRNPDGMSKSMVSRTVQTEQNEEQSAFTQRVENGQQTQLKEEQNSSQRASPNRKRRNLKIAPVVQLQIKQNKGDQTDNKSIKSNSESELSVEYQMQFFKSSNPVEQPSFDANQQIPPLPHTSQQQQQFQRKLRHQIDFWRDFVGEPADQQRIIRKWVLETTQSQPQPSSQEQQPLKQPVYDIFS